MSTKLSAPLAQKLLFYGMSAGAVALASSARADQVTANISGDNIYFDPTTGAFSATDPTLPFSLTTTSSNGTNPKNGAPKATNTATASGGSVGGFALNTNNYVINSPSSIDGSQTYSSGPLNRSSNNTYIPLGGDDTFQTGGSGFIGFEATVNGTTNYGYADITFNGFGAAQGTYTLADFTVVPEPSTVALLVTGAAGVALWRRRRQARNAV